MTKIRVFANAGAADKASQHILVSCKEVGLRCTTGHQGQVSLIAMGLANGDVYIFDVKGSRDVLFDGGVCRILQSPDILKVMHNCLDSVAAFHKQHGILTQNVFDTQLAFSLVLESEGLPARKLSLASLCEQSWISQYRPSPALQTLLREDGDIWMRRPLTTDSLNTLASTVTPLYPMLHRKLTRILHERGELNSCEEISREDIQRRIDPRKSKTSKTKSILNTDEERKSKYRNKNIKLTSQQRLRLSGMMPVIMQDIK